MLLFVTNNVYQFHLKFNKTLICLLYYPFPTYTTASIVDLYPLEKTIKAGGTEEEVIKNTDLGGVALLRSAAKGRRIVISCPEDREKVLKWLKEGEPKSAYFRRWLAGKAELTVSDYCRASGLYILTRPN